MKTSRSSLLVVTVLLLLAASAFAQGTQDTSYIWPIADHKGTICLQFGHVISPKTNLPVFNDGYFFAVPAGTPLVAIGDGVISTSATHSYLNPNMIQSMSFHGTPSDSELRASGYVPEQFFGDVGLSLGHGLTIYYQGLTHDIAVKTGQKVKKGDTLGYAGYMKCFFDSPTVHIVASLQRKVSDLGNYIFGKDYVSKDSLIGKEPPYDASKKFPVEQLQEDFKIIRDALEEGHPGLYTYTPKEEFDRLFDAAYRELSTPRTEDEFARIISSLLSRIGCGHTNLIRSKPFNDANLNLLPIDVAFVGDTCYVVKDWRDSSAFAPGTEILTFDGRPALEVRESLRALCTGDGTKPSFQDSWLNGALFKRYLYLAYGPSRRHALQIKGKDGQIRAASVPAMPRQEIVKRKIAAAKKAAQSQQPDAVELTYFDSTTAYMKVLDFALFDKDRITEFFKELEAKHPANLVLDLRGNPGGTSENLSFLYSFIANDDFMMQQYWLANKRGPYDFFRNTDNYYPDIPVNMEFEPRNGGSGFVRVSKPESPQTEHRYSGRVYVLMNGGTFSAAAMLCGVMHRQKRATLIGEETGGAFYQINAEQFAYVKLKNLPIQIRVPLNEVVITEEIDPRIPQGRGVLPDYEVLRSLEDLTHGTVQGLPDPDHDSVLDYAKQLIARNN